MYVNNYQCCGNLVADPDLKDYRGTAYAKFTIALNKPKAEKPIYIPCIAWGSVGSAIAEYCGKGQEVSLCGEIEISSYTDKQGITRQSTSLKVREFSAGRNPRNMVAEVPRPSVPKLSPWDSQRRE